MRTSKAFNFLVGSALAASINFTAANDAEAGNSGNHISGCPNGSTCIINDGTGGGMPPAPGTGGTVTGDFEQGQSQTLNGGTQTMDLTNQNSATAGIEQSINLIPTTNVTTGPTNVTVPVTVETPGGYGENFTTSEAGASATASPVITVDPTLSAAGGNGTGTATIEDVHGGSGTGIATIEGVEGGDAKATATTGEIENHNQSGANSDADAKGGAAQSDAKGGSVNQNYGRPGAMPGILGSLGPNLHVPQECGSGFGFSVFGGAPYLLTIGGGMSKIDTGFRFENGHTVGDILGAETSDQRQKMMEGLSGADNRRLSCVVGYAQIRMAMQEAGYDRQEDLKRMDQDFSMTVRALEHLQKSGPPGSVESFLAMRVDDFAEALQATFFALRRAEANGKITREDINSENIKPSAQIAILEELFQDPGAMRRFKDAQDRRQEERANRKSNPWGRFSAPAAAPSGPEM